MKKNTEQPKIYYSDFGVSLASPRCFFHDNLSFGSFVYDRDTHQKYLISKQPKQSEIVAIASDGAQVISIDTVFDTRKRFIRIVEVETQDELAKTKVAFGYEAQFTPIEDVILIRGDIKKREKVFLFNVKTEEIVYTFPGANPLSYGHLNVELKAFVIPNPRKKAEVFHFDFQTGEGRVVQLQSNRLIHRVSLVGNNAYFYIDGDYIATLYQDGAVVWQTKLNFDDSLHYAPEYFIKHNKVYFSYVYDMPMAKEGEQLLPCFYTLSLETGQLEPIEIKDKTCFGFYHPFIGNQVINSFGTCIDLETLESEELDATLFY